MNLLKSISKKDRSNGVVHFRKLLEDYLHGVPGPTDRKALADMAELISVHRQLNALEALRVLKDHIKQGCGWEPPHRLRALQAVEYFSCTCTALVPVFMEQLTTTKWRDRLKKVAVASYSPPLQDAVVQLVFTWASAYRSHEWGVGMQQLLFELEEEGIIVEGAWKLDGAKPQVIALLGSPNSPTSKATSPSGSGFGSSRPERAASSRLEQAGSSSRHGATQPSSLPATFSEESLLLQADGMSADAVALLCASGALNNALEAAEAGTPAAGGPPLPELHQNGMQLSARCTLHLARLQEALARSTQLSDEATAQLIDVADALNTQQERWQQAAHMYSAALKAHSKETDTKTSAAGTAGAATSSSAGAAAAVPTPAVKAAPVPDLMSLDDEPVPVPVQQQLPVQQQPAASPLEDAFSQLATGSLGAAEVAQPPPVAPQRAVAAGSSDPFAELAAAAPLTSIRGTDALAVGGGAGAPVETGVGAAVVANGQFGGFPPPQPQQPTQQQQLQQLQQPQPLVWSAASHGGVFPVPALVHSASLSMGLQSAASLPLSPSNPFALPGQSSDNTGMAPQPQPWQPGGIPAYAMPAQPVATPQVVATFPTKQQEAQAWDRAAQRAAVAMHEMQVRHEQELAAVTMRAAQAMAGMQERIAQLERQLASQGGPVQAHPDMQATALSAPVGGPAAAEPVAVGTKQAGAADSWISF